MISLLRSSINVASISDRECPAIKMGDRIPGHSLVGHVIRSFLANSEDHCFVQCIITDGHVCASYNLGPVRSDGKYPCELNKADHIKYEEDLNPKPGYIYSANKVFCRAILTHPSLKLHTDRLVQMLRGGVSR